MGIMTHYILVGKFFILQSLNYKYNLCNKGKVNI